eukprot:TRINITY_DN116111_c0_g1_i1.p2 TRINITY_DN116111_c0_g1~~TRINITY_DN116111_c0_g1_i1.p2  ORF type:complete len:247 (+),score=79.35 TRINITY_DN116111_c0_g1_i1:77-742(+)
MRRTGRWKRLMERVRKSARHDDQGDDNDGDKLAHITNDASGTGLDAKLDIGMDFDDLFDDDDDPAGTDVPSVAVPESSTAIDSDSDDELLVGAGKVDEVQRRRARLLSATDGDGDKDFDDDDDASAPEPPSPSSCNSKKRKAIADDSDDDARAKRARSATSGEDSWDAHIIAAFGTDKTLTLASLMRRVGKERVLKDRKTFVASVGRLCKPDPATKTLELK